MAKSFLQDNSGVSVIIGAMLLILITIVAAAGLALIVSQSEKQAADRQAQIDAVNSENLKIASISITNGSPPSNNKITDLALDIMNLNTADAKVMAVIVNGKYVTNYTTVSKPPDFTADAISGSAPLTVQFSDTSQDSPTGWQWDFGDGTPIVILQNPPPHTYTTPGNYSVTLKVTTSTGSDQVTKINYIQVKDPGLDYHVDFSSDVQTGPDPLTVHFYDKSTIHATSWDWNFGDGTAHGNTSSPVHNYTSAGPFDVTLTVNGGSSHMTKSKYIIVDTAPVASFAYYPEPNCGMASSRVDFIDTSYGHPTSWYWDFGDGSTSYDQNPVHIYDIPGTYTVTLNVANAMGSSTSPSTKTFTIVSPVQATMPMTISGGSHKYIDINSTMGASQGLGITTDKPITIEIVTSYVNYFKTFYNPPNAVQKVNIETQNLGLQGPRDYLVLDGSGSSSINSTIVSWKWDICDMSKTNPMTLYGRITQLYPPTNDGYFVRLTVTDNNGMTSTSDTISIPPDANFNPTPTATPTATPTPKPLADFTAAPTNGSPGVSVQFTDYSSNMPTSWLWDFGDGNTSTTQNPTHIYSTANTYSVSLTATNAGGSNTRTKSGYITVS